MNLPKITIVTPSYNSELFIAGTLDSVLGQGYPDLEYLVFDGGSTDTTSSILATYDKKISSVSERDSGQSDAINKGLRKAKGEIVAWLNSNDLLLPGALETVGRYFSEHPDVQLVFGKAKLLSEDGEFIGDYEEVGKPSDIAEEMLALNSVEKGHYQRLLNTHPGWIPQMAAFWRTSTMREAGYLDVDLHYAMDYEYWLRLGSRGSIHFINEYLGAFRLHESAKSSNARKHWHEILLVRRRYHGDFFCNIHAIFLGLVWKGLLRRLHI